MQIIPYKNIYLCKHKNLKTTFKYNLKTDSNIRNNT